MRISDWSSDVCSSDLMFCLALSCLTLSRLTLSCLGAPERSPEHDIVTNRPTAASRKLAKGASAPRQIATEIRRRSEEHTSELQSLMRISYAVFCLKKKKHYIKK